jgi:hypothetical protein
VTRHQYIAAATISGGVHVSHWWRVTCTPSVNRCAWGRGRRESRVARSTTCINGGCAGSEERGDGVCVHVVDNLGPRNGVCASGVVACGLRSVSLT